MRQFAHLAAEILLGMLVKARLILIFTVLAVGALIWVDRYTRGLFG
jgi:hypothetical protein